MTENPEDARRLAEERAAARAAKDFARADALRAEIAALGYEVADRPGGYELKARAPYDAVRAADAPSALGEPPTRDFSVHLLYEGFPGDLERFLSGLERHCAHHDYEVVLVDNDSGEGAALERRGDSHRDVRALHLSPPAGWAEARNAGLRGSRGRIVVIADLSVEPRGDVLAPLAGALSDPGVGVAGPFGLVTRDLHEFEPAPGPGADAIEGYLLALRREQLAAGTLFREQFRWYRHADLDLSFAVLAAGLRAQVVDCPVERHAHRGWETLDDAERARLSKRNFYRFYDRWKTRRDLLLASRD